ncbi:MAG: TraB/GumN family protein [Pseudomonadota bacterium]
MTYSTSFNHGQSPFPAKVGIDRTIALWLALKSALVAAFFITVFLIAGQSEARADETGPVCAGANLWEPLEVAAPEIVETLKAQAKADWPNGEAKFWKVERGDLAPSWLFGTAHLADPRVLDIGDAARSAFEGADTLVVEIVDIQASAQKVFADPEMRDTFFFTDGSTIENHLTDEEVASIRARLEGGESPWFLAKRMKPWLVLGLLAPPKCEAERKAAGSAILDTELQTIAKAQGMEVVGLETAKEQFMALSSLGFDNQLIALREIATQTELLDDMTKTMIDMYVEGRIDLIWPMLEYFAPSGDDGESQRAEFESEIVTNRNLRMAERSLPFLKHGGAFIAVGALHLPGEQGLVSLLRREGYTVTPVMPAGSGG